MAPRKIGPACQSHESNSKGAAATSQPEISNSHQAPQLDDDHAKTCSAIPFVLAISHHFYIITNFRIKHIYRQPTSNNQLPRASVRMKTKTSFMIAKTFPSPKQQTLHIPSSPPFALCFYPSSPFVFIPHLSSPTLISNKPPAP